MPPKTLGLFAQTSHKGNQETAFSRLLLSVINAEPESYQQIDETILAAIAILKRYPALLFKKERIKDHFNREIEASPFQLLWGASDTWALKQVYQSILTNKGEGDAKAKIQFQEQFPNCPWPFTPDMSEEVLYDDRNKAQIAQVIAQLKTIVGKISADPCTNGLATCSETTEVVAELCQIFAPKEGEVIRTGLHFPQGIMDEIFKIYNNSAWSAAQLSFFSREVIGGASAALSAVDGQCWKYGLSNLDMNKGPDRRDGLFCQHPKGIPQKLAPLAGKLGSKMFVDPYDGKACFLSSKVGYFDWYNKSGACGGDGRVGRAWGVCGPGAVWKTYGEQKQRHMGAIMQPHEEKSTHRLGHHEQSMRCVIF
jgi:hypothetical protein